jgi:hypothetical protein
MGVSLCWAGDDIDQRAEDRDEQDKDGPPSLCETVVVLPAEVVDEAPDDEKDHQEYAGKNKHRPEQAQQGK